MSAINELHQEVKQWRNETTLIASRIAVLEATIAHQTDQKEDR